MITKSTFQPAWWLQGPHRQTMWPTLMRRAVRIESIQERVELPDGDFVDLDWVELGEQTPLVVILHGLEGSIHSPYAKGILKALKEGGYSSVFMHFRGCSGEHNRLDRAYHSGETEDLSYLVSVLKARFPNRRLGAVGYSLGGNVLMKWLGETGNKNPLSFAVGVSVPFQLNLLADKMSKGFSKIYQWYLVSRLKRKFARKNRLVKSKINFSGLQKLRTFWEFDDQVTAPMHGFEGAEDYYQKSSCRQYLKGIAIPTLILHAIDDPFMVPEVVPDENELSDSVTLELSDRGGHVGFVSNNGYWLESRVKDFIESVLMDSLLGAPRATEQSP